MPRRGSFWIRCFAIFAMPPVCCESIPASAAAAVATLALGCRASYRKAHLQRLLTACRRSASPFDEPARYA